MRSVGRFLIAVLAILAVSCERKPAQLFFPETEIDLGTMATNDAVHTYDLEFQNQGDEDLIIETAFPSCECVTVERFDTVTAGGKKGTIRLRYDFSIYPAGDIERSVTITSNSADTCLTEVFLHAKLKYAD